MYKSPNRDTKAREVTLSYFVADGAHTARSRNASDDQEGVERECKHDRTGLEAHQGMARKAASPPTI